MTTLGARSAPPPARGGVVLITDQGLALIERIRDGHRYYVLPGGRCETGEIPEAAAVRETFEELGVHVQSRGLIAVVSFRHQQQHYFLVDLIDGTFGSGTGSELRSAVDSPLGSYRPVWLPLDAVSTADVRPSPLAALLPRSALAVDNVLSRLVADPVTLLEN